MLSKPGTFDGGLSEGAAPPPEGYIQPHLGHGLRIWWAYYWPTLLISTLLIIVFTILLRKAWENVMVSGHFVIWASRVLPYIVLAFVSPLGIWRILTKKFKSFQIALLPRYAAFGAEPLSCSFQRTLRVWWAFLWRTVVYSLIFRFAGSVGLGMTLGFLTSVAGPLGPLVSFLFQILIDAAVGLFVVYSALLDEELGDFRVTLVPRGMVPIAAAAVASAASNPVR